MKPWYRCAYSLFGSILLCLTLTPLVPAQQAFRAVEQVEPDDVLRLLDEGLRLESERRWGEALNHYEEAARLHPQNSQLQQRMMTARLHFDLSRRYVDSSFLVTLRQLSEQQTLDLYNEVVLKIQSHYVDDPNWNQLLRWGTSSLRIALSDPKFHEVNRTVANEQSEAILQYVDQVLSQRDVRDRQQAQDLVRWVGQLCERRLGIAANAVMLEYICGATSALDTYSTFLTPDQLNEVYSQIEGNFVGLGIELKGDEGTLLIANVITNGPAARAGMVAGERIVGVDGRSIRDMSTDEAADLLKGEQGSYVEVTLLTPEGQTRKLHVRRERVEVPSVEQVQIVDRDNGVGYFRISSFQKTTSRDVDAALWKLHRDGMRSLIVDVRGNPGGLLNESVEVADRFVAEGTIVATHGRSARENYDYKAHQVGTWRVPLVVLIDGDSASASEIFAGAIRDHRRGTVVGDRSYGKGSVQGIFPLRAVRGGIRLTTAKFYSPSGRAISQGGVEPDVAVRTTLKPNVMTGGQLSLEQDEVLAAGTKIAREMVAARVQSLETEASRSALADPRHSLERSTRGW
jgi:carboxyl-terminal processing protease